MEYIYCGETNIHTSEIDKFMETARILEITGFVQKVNVILLLLCQVLLKNLLIV